ncbi:MAG: hypothetical protein WC683_06815 [bacterium]
MPRKMNGKTLTEHEHEIWRAVFSNTHSGAIATAAVKKRRAKRRKSHA